MNIEERRRRNEELRTKAPIPVGVEDLRGITFRNKYNSAIITIISSKITDLGNIFWRADVGGIYDVKELNNHWNRLTDIGMKMLEQEE